jgi:hypothetical protein
MRNSPRHFECRRFTRSPRYSSDSVRKYGIIPDFHARLAVVAAFIAGYQDESTEDWTEIHGLVSDQRIPGLWRLWMLLHSVKLAERYSDDLMELAEDPSTSAGRRGGEFIRSCAKSCMAASETLAGHSSGLATTLSEVRSRLDAWQAKFAE